MDIYFISEEEPGSNFRVCDTVLPAIHRFEKALPGPQWHQIGFFIFLA